MADHPGIVLRDGPAGRRAALAGHRLDVGQVVETVQREGGDVDAAADYLSLSPGVVDAAVGYYADHRDEVDDWISRSTAIADEAEAAWRRRRSALQR